MVASGSPLMPPLEAGAGDAAAAIGAVHVRLARERDEALRAQEALSAIQTEAAVPDGARIVAALRGSGYGIPAVRDVVGTLHRLEGISEGVAEARQILDLRLDQIAARTIALLRAGTDLAAVLEAP